MSIRPQFLLTAVLVATASAAVADEVTLTNGRTMRGEVLSEPGADPLVLKTPAGKVKLPRSLVKEVLRDRRRKKKKKKKKKPRKTPKPSPKPSPSPKTPRAPQDIPDELPARRTSFPLLNKVNPLPPKPALPDAKQLPALMAKGDPRSLTLAGIVYEDGRGLRYDHKRAMALYLKAAAAGDGLAMSRLSSAYAQGHGVDTNYDLAKEWGLAAAEAKDPFGLALVAAWGWGISTYSPEVAAERYLEAAIAGDLRGYYFVGKYKDSGKGFPRNVVDSARWYARGAELGHPGCMDQHATNLAYGSGLERDRVAAARWAKLSWSKGDSFGSVKHAKFLRWGFAGAPDPAQALELLERFVAGNRNQATGLANFQLGETYRQGWGVQVDFKKALDYLKVAFTLGYEESIPALGYMLYMGQGGEKDLATARKLWELGAERDNAWSIRNLGYRAREGTWAAKDPAKARALFLRAAELGDAVSMFELGCMTFHGQGGPADRAGGVQWLEKSAAEGNAAAAREVGRCYTEGWLGATDLARARRAYKTSWERGDQAGSASYAWMLAYGRGGPVDAVKAEKILQEGVAKKHPHATYLLGRLYCDGAKGVPVNPTQAKKLLKVAAGLGSKVASAELRARGW